CGNDLLAFAVIRTLAELGLSVPGDVLVTGVDDTDLAEMHLPSLTSVSLESARRGSLAAAMMLGRLASPDLPPRLEQVPARLVVRESSQPARPSLHLTSAGLASPGSPGGPALTGDLHDPRP
ncbi:MAG TPA: substrate-binding domain-containing protein, partial [Streptosporangiaceae bacterium]